MTFAVLFVACSNPSTTVSPPDALSSPPAPVLARTLTLTAGPAWNPDLPADQQDLADHFTAMAQRFEHGELLAYGPRLDTGLGLYVYLDEVAGPNDALLSTDPGIANGVLALHEAGTWMLAVDLLDAPAGDVFLLEYLPGPAWESGLPLTEQDLDDHLSYVGGLVSDGVMLAGGPAGTDHGRYAVTARDLDAAVAVVAEDPSVMRGLFAPTVHPWALLQRQSVGTARAAAEAL